MKILFFLFSLSSILGDENKFFPIKQMIQRGEIESALRQTEELLKEFPADATLALYQAEAYIERGERFYRRKKYKSAFKDYERVYKVWQNNLLARNRYNELKSRPVLIDEEVETEKKILSMVVPLGLQGGLEKRMLEENSKAKVEISEEAKILFEHTKRIEQIFLFSIILFCSTNVILLYLLMKRRKP